MKRILCFFLGHEWTSKSIKGVKIESISYENFKDYAKLYCGRCGCESKLNKRLDEFAGDPPPKGFIAEEEVATKALATFLMANEKEHQN